ncbi:hypothetical protein pkur_cds_877 [Pandoravirus kuranda]|uniref:Uncharacterized protein n=1 Tax=Pandoravirus kuranda TaxID=3019033 RepID=A0AA95EDM3_9VIRU|nr:hypothetical protein pkur_cds_1 [Pandoravirus kuranda]WBR15051.1 hypothetical protein pkur_cds_877 [Pandoravirus kuranda]
MDQDTGQSDGHSTDSQAYDDDEGSYSDYDDDVEEEAEPLRDGERICHVHHGPMGDRHQQSHTDNGSKHGNRGENGTHSVAKNRPSIDDSGATNRDSSDYDSSDINSDSDNSNDDDDGTDDDSSDDDSDDDDGGGGALDHVKSLCAAWNTNRLQLCALKTEAASIRKERAKVAKRIIDYMRGAGIDCARGPLDGRRIKVRLVRCRVSTSLSDAVLADAFNKYAADASTSLYDEAVKTTLAIATRRARKRARETEHAMPPADRNAKRRRSRTSDTQAMPPPPAHNNGGDGSDGGSADTALCSPMQDHNGGAKGSEHVITTDNLTDHETAGAETPTARLHDVLAGAIVWATRKAQEARSGGRRALKVQTYAGVGDLCEPLTIGQDHDNGEDDDEGDADLPPLVIEWAKQFHDYDTKLAEIGQRCVPFRNAMDALTRDLGLQETATAQTSASSPSSSSSSSSTSTNTTGDLGEGTTDKELQALRPRAKAALEKRRLHAQYATLRDSVAAYLNARASRLNDQSGLAVKFPGASAGGTYRVCVKQHQRKGAITREVYNDIATVAASTTLAAAGIDPDVPYSPTTLRAILADDHVRAALINTLKTSIVQQKERRIGTPVRTIVFAKVASRAKGASSR